MPWFKVDDNLAFHAKAVAAGNPAIGLWTRAGSWCAQQLTDGFVPDHMLAALGTKGQAEKLVAVRLWDRVQGGYRFHEWHERQPSRVDVEAERAAAKERMRLAREAKKLAAQGKKPQVSGSGSESVRPNKPRSSGEVREKFGNPDPTRPDPTRPDPSTGVDESPAPSAADLIAEWIDHCDERPPSRVVGQISKEIKSMLTEGIEYERVRTGLAEWNRKGLHPSTLASVVHELANKKPTQTTSKADQRMQANVAVVRELRAREEAQANQQRAIGDGR